MKTSTASTELTGAVDRLTRLLNAHNRIQQDQAMLSEDLSQDELGARYAEIERSLLDEFAIPRDTWTESGPAFSPKEVRQMLRDMKKWCAGVMDRAEASEFFTSIDEEADLDWGYIFLGAPLARMATEAETEDMIVAFGCRKATCA